MKTKSTTLIVAAVAVLTLSHWQQATAQSWVIGGNTVTKDTTLGTKNSFALRFITNNSLRMTLTSIGDFGVGTFIPAARLEVMRSSGVSNIARFTNSYTGSAGDRSALIDIRNGNGTIWRYGVGGTNNSLGLNNGQFYIERSGAGAKLTITNNGFVGIGITNPISLLDVAGRMRLRWDAESPGTKYSNAANSADVAFIGLKDDHNIGFYSYNPNVHWGLLMNTDNGNVYLSNGLYFNGTLTMHATGNNNFFVGTNAGNTTITGHLNTGTGSSALNSLTSGGYNTANGYRALFNNTAGDSNTAVGNYALYSNTTGHENTAIGETALISNTTGSGNTALGEAAGVTITTGSYNTFIGSGTNSASDNSTDDVTNATALGYNAIVDASNEVRIGNSDVTSIGGHADWTNISDGRVKKNIKNNVPGLAFINKLSPITYNLDLEAADRITQRPATKTKDGKNIAPPQEDIAARKAKEQIVYTGFIAQEVEKAAKELNYDFSGVDATKNDKDLYGLRYADFVVPLVKAVQELSNLTQELSKKNDEKDTRITDLTTKIADLQKQMDELRGVKTAGTPGTAAQESANSLMLTNASLDQNNPNPFTVATTIRYNLPVGFRTAHIVITDNTGKAIKQVQLNTTGAGTINIDAATLTSGTYTYSLVVDGKVVENKKMIVAH